MALVLGAFTSACAGGPVRQDPACTRTSTTPSASAPVTTSSSSGTPSGSVSSTGATPAGPTTVAASAPAFPLSAKADSPYLVDSADQPFLIVGDAAWSLVAELSVPQARDYLRARKAAGFNTVLVNLVEHQFASNAPSNVDGVAPFVGSAFGQADEAYFRHADQILDEAAALGFLVLLTPAYAGYDGGDEGWYPEMVAAGPERLRRWGEWVGARYAGNDHILWVQGGDYDVPDQGLVDAIAEGIAAKDPQALQTYHSKRNKPIADRWGTRAWLDVETVYTGEDVLSEVHSTFESSHRPFFLVEAVYENESGIDAAGLRRQAWQAVLGGAGGQVFGNDPMWSFGTKEGTGTQSWRQALDSPGTQGIHRLSALLTRMRWWLLCPDLTGDLLEGAGSDTDDPVAAFSPETGEAVLYLPRGGEVALDLSALGGSRVQVTWYDPTSGREVGAGAHATSGATRLRPPGANDAGDADWVMVARRE